MIVVIGFIAVCGSLIGFGALGMLVGVARRDDLLRNASVWLIIWTVAAVALFLPGLLVSAAAA